MTYPKIFGRAFGARKTTVFKGFSALKTTYKPQKFPPAAHEKLLFYMFFALKAPCKPQNVPPTVHNFPYRPLKMVQCHVARRRREIFENGSMKSIFLGVKRS